MADLTRAFALSREVGHQMGGDHERKRGVTPEKAFTSAVEKYSDEQPRDDNGRWTDGGSTPSADSWSAGPAGHPHASQQDQQVPRPPAAPAGDGWGPRWTGGGSRWTEDGQYIGTKPVGGFKPDIPSMPQSHFFSQVAQYPKKGPEGIGYFKGVLSKKDHVDCLLFRAKKDGPILGILNHFPKDMPPFEKKGNVTVFVHPDHQRKGIATRLMQEAGKRWEISLMSQTYTPEGARLANALSKPRKKSGVVYVTKYSEDQPRDDHGRWTDGSGSSDEGSSSSSSSSGSGGDSRVESPPSGGDGSLVSSNGPVNAIAVLSNTPAYSGPQQTMESIAAALEGGRPPREWDVDKKGLTEEQREQVRENWRTAERQIREELRYQDRQERSGKTWYDEETRQAYEITQQFIPSLRDNPVEQTIFATIGGIMSPATSPDDSWFDTARAFEVFKETGVIPDRDPLTGNHWQGYGNIKADQINTLNNMIRDLGGIDKAAEWLMQEHPRYVIAYAREVWGGSKNTDFVQRTAGEMVAGVSMFGKKEGNFILACNGMDATPVDRWATKTFNRYFDRITDRRDGSIKDSPMNDKEGEAIRRLFEGAAKDVGMKNKEAQAELWFFEQRLYSHLGTRSESNDFVMGARKYVDYKRNRS